MADNYSLQNEIPWKSVLLFTTRVLEIEISLLERKSGENSDRDKTAIFFRQSNVLEEVLLRWWQFLQKNPQSRIVRYLGRIRRIRQIWRFKRFVVPKWDSPNLTLVLWVRRERQHVYLRDIFIINNYWRSPTLSFVISIQFGPFQNCWMTTLLKLALS